MKKMRSRHPRGYILMEALAGGIILATALVTVFNQLGLAERRAAAEIRRGQAQAALLDGINRVRGMNISALATCTGNTSPCEDDKAVPNTPPNSMRRTIIVTSLGAGSTVCPDCIQIEVTVEYRDAAKRNWATTTSGWRTVRAITFMPPGV